MSDIISEAPEAATPSAAPSETKRFRFRVGDRVEWSQHAGHAGGYGHVGAIVNAEGTYVRVDFDIDGSHELSGKTGESLMLTEDEIIHSDEPAAQA